MNARSKHKDAAFKFMAFYCSEEGQRILAAGRNCLPSNISVARSAFLKGLPDGAKNYVDIALGETVVPSTQVPNWDEVMSRAITPVLDQMYYGQQTPAEALKTMARKTQEVLSKQ